jgi:hypothetical protein
MADNGVAFSAGDSPTNKIRSTAGNAIVAAPVGCPVW